MSDTSENHATNPPSAITDRDLDEITGGTDDLLSPSPISPIVWACALIEKGVVTPYPGTTQVEMVNSLLNAFGKTQIDFEKLVVLINENLKQ